MKKTIQKQRILEYMDKHGSITSMEGQNELGIARTASRICDLRKAGYNIVSEWVTVKDRYGDDCRVKRYSLGEDNG
jgi:hypothetical protein